MPDVIFALDPGQTTGWAMLRRRDKLVLGMGDLTSQTLGSAIDLLVRGMHRLSYTVVPVVEQMPTPNGVGGSLALELSFVRRTIEHWLSDVFELEVFYVLPGAWKPSRVAQTTECPKTWQGEALSQHQRDAFVMGSYFVGRRR